MAEFDSFHRLAIEAITGRVDDERRDALALQFGVHSREQQHDVGNAGIGYPVLLAADTIAAVGLLDGVRR